MVHIVGFRSGILDDSHVVHKSPCQESYCTRDNFACLPNSVGTLIGVCHDEVVNKSVKVVYYLRDGNGVQPFQRQMVLDISSPIYSIISAIIIQFNQNLEEEGILKGIEQDDCKNKQSKINVCEDIELNLTCLPDRATCAIMDFNCIKSKDILFVINIYDEKRKKIVEKYVNINTSWKYYYYLSKLLCEYQNFKKIPRYTMQYRIFLTSNESNKLSTYSTQDKSDQVLQRITDGIIGFCICLIPLCSYLVYRRMQTTNYHQPINNENSANYNAMTFIPSSGNTDDSFKDHTVHQVDIGRCQDLDVKIGQTSA